MKGNEVLRLLFKLLCKYFTPDSIYRIGGDEFIVVLEKSLSKEEIIAILKQVESELGLNVNFDIKLCNVEKDDVKNIIKDFRKIIEQFIIKIFTI